MSCIQVYLQRIDSSLELKREGYSFLTLEESPQGYVSIKRVLYNAYAELSRVCSCVSLQRQLSGLILERVCEVIEAPYLEIEPELIWVYPDFEVDNNVYSNVTWNVD